VYVFVCYVAVCFTVLSGCLGAHLPVMGAFLCVRVWVCSHGCMSVCVLMCVCVVLHGVIILLSSVYCEGGRGRTNT
jgi:hypothetical protein